jgi:hypothetical protein
MAVKQHHHRNQKSQGKSVVRGRLMRFIKRVTPRKLLLMMRQLLLLFWT